MQFCLSTVAGLESLVKKEIEKQGGKITKTIDKMVFFEGEINLIPKLNLHSRFANKMYVVLAQSSKVTNFDELYDLVGTVNWKNIRDKSYPILVNATSVRSEITSTPAMQKITKKSIVDKITQKKVDFLNEDEKLNKQEIFVFLLENQCYILLNTSGEALHKRGYRTETGEAPIKENLAAAIVQFSDWRFKDNFYDIFCGSGTIAIEAAMMAKNIAPGINRTFAFEDRGWIDKKLISEEIDIAKSKIFKGSYNIFASDIDPEMIKIASYNAKRAGVEDVITFTEKSVYKYNPEDLSGNLVSNPPYGIRLKDDKLIELYKHIDKLFQKNETLKGGIITSFTDFETVYRGAKYKKRKLFNGGEMCYFYLKNKI